MKNLIFIALLAIFSLTNAYSQIIGDSTDIVWQVPLTGQYPTRIVFSPDNNYLLTDCLDKDNNRSLLIRSIVDGKLIKELIGENAVTFSKDGNFFVTKNINNINVWNAKTFNLIKSISTNGIQFSFSFSPDKNFIANAADVLGVRIFDYSTGAIVKEIKNFPFIYDPKFGGQPRAGSVEYSNDGNKILFYGDYTFVYDLQKDTMEIQLDGLLPQFSPNCNFIANLTNHTLNIFNTTDYNKIQSIPMNNNIFDFCFTNDNKYIITASVDDNLKVINLKDFNIEYIFPSPIAHVASSYDNKYIAFFHGYLILLKANWNSTHVEESTTKQTFEISPNPAFDFIEISVRANGRSPLQCDVRIFDVLGEIQTTPSLRDTPPWKGGEIVKIDVSGLAPGMYFVRIGDKVKKFVKL